MENLERFGTAPASSAIPRGEEIHVWVIGLEPPKGEIDRLRGVLSDDENARADRFHFPIHRHRYIAGRGALREILARYMRRPPGSLGFRYGDKDKPYLQQELDSGPLHFNLSHSENLGLLAVSTGRELGIDIERLRPMPDALQLAESFFSSSERVALRDEPEETRHEAFFRCWTRKEAYIKAVGDGLSLPLDSFDVRFDAHRRPRFLALDGDPARAEQWSLYHLEPAPGYVAALAVEGRGWKLEGWRWPGVITPPG